MAQAERELLRQVVRLFFSLLLLAPLVGDSVAEAAGYYIFLLADAPIQSVMAGLLLLWALAVHLLAWRRRPQGSFLWMEAALWLAGAGLYGYSLYQTFFAPIAQGKPSVFYLDVAVLAVLLQVVRLVRAHRRVRQASVEE